MGARQFACVKSGAGPVIRALKHIAGVLMAASVLPAGPAAAAGANSNAEARVVSLDPDDLANGAIEIVLTETADKPGGVAVRATNEVTVRGGAAADRDASRPGALTLAGTGRVTITVEPAARSENSRTLVPVAMAVRGRVHATATEGASATVRVTAGDDRRPVVVGATFVVPPGAEPGVYRAELSVDRPAPARKLVGFE